MHAILWLTMTWIHWWGCMRGRSCGTSLTGSIRRTVFSLFWKTSRCRRRVWCPMRSLPSRKIRCATTRSALRRCSLISTLPVRCRVSMRWVMPMRFSICRRIVFTRPWTRARRRCWVRISRTGILTGFIISSPRRMTVIRWHRWRVRSVCWRVSRGSPSFVLPAGRMWLHIP